MKSIEAGLLRMQTKVAQDIIARGRAMLPRPLNGKSISQAGRLWRGMARLTARRRIERGKATLAKLKQEH